VEAVPTGSDVQEVAYVVECRKRKSCALREKMQGCSTSSNASSSRKKRTPHRVMSHLLLGTRKWGDLVEREQSDRDSMNRQCLVRVVLEGKERRATPKSRGSFVRKRLERHKAIKSSLNLMAAFAASVSRCTCVKLQHQAVTIR
jgi:hypothetical protein